MRRSVRSSRAVKAFMKRWGHIMSPIALTRIALEYPPQLQGSPAAVSPGTESISGRSARMRSNISPTPPYIRKGR